MSKSYFLYPYVGLVTLGSAALLGYKAYDMLDQYDVNNMLIQTGAVAACGIAGLIGGAYLGLRSGTVL